MVVNLLIEAGIERELRGTHRTYLPSSQLNTEVRPTQLCDLKKHFPGRRTSTFPLESQLATETGWGPCCSLDAPDSSHLFRSANHRFQNTYPGTP